MTTSMNHKFALLAATLFVVTTVPKADANAATGENSGADGPSRPNIIFLFTDDQRDDTFGAMGHPFVKTPQECRSKK